MAIKNYLEVPQSIRSVKFFSICLASIALLTVCSKIQVPLFPVPFTLQTVAVLIIPAFFGLTLSMSALSGWLALGFIGLPVVAGNTPLIGPAYFLGPTGGYFVGFIAATVMTALTLHKWCLKNKLALLGVFLMMHALILVAGWFWLGYGLPQLGAEKAWISGIYPFLPGAVIKSVMVTALVYPVIIRQKKNKRAD